MTAIPTIVTDAPASKMQALPRTCIGARRRQARLRLRTTSPQVLYQGGIIAHRAAAEQVARRKTLRAMGAGVILLVLGVVALLCSGCEQPMSAAPPDMEPSADLSIRHQCPRTPCHAPSDCQPSDCPQAQDRGDKPWCAFILDPHGPSRGYCEWPIGMVATGDMR